MFVHMKNIPAKAADAIDLLIELATLGEYGLEYPDQRPEMKTIAPCGPGRTRVKPTTRIERPRRNAPVARPKPSRSRRGTCPTRATALPEALMPPRITLDLNA